MTTRRQFFKNAGLAGGAAIATAITSTSVSKVAMAALPEPMIQTSAETMPPWMPDSGHSYNPVVTLNGWTLPWRMRQGVKEFHLVAEPVVREMAPGMKAHLWGYNGQSPVVCCAIHRSRSALRNRQVPPSLKAGIFSSAASR